MRNWSTSSYGWRQHVHIIIAHTSTNDVLEREIDLVDSTPPPPLKTNVMAIQHLDGTLTIHSLSFIFRWSMFSLAFVSFIVKKKTKNQQQPQPTTKKGYNLLHCYYICYGVVDKTWEYPANILWRASIVVPSRPASYRLKNCFCGE